MASSSLLSSLLVTACIILPLCAAQATCKGKCGGPFSRGKPCQCDNDCFTYDECCKDFEVFCTRRDSCRGRCGEVFRRGRQCDCDTECALYNTCCSDHHAHCVPPKNVTTMKTDFQPLKSKPEKPLTSESEEAGRGLQNPVAMDQMPKALDIMSEYTPLSADPSLYAITDDHSLFSTPLQATAATPSYSLGSESATPASAFPASGPPAGAAQSGAYSNGTPLIIPVQVSLSISDGSSSLASGPTRPSTLMDVAQGLAASQAAALLNDSTNIDLCNGRPIDGLAALLNGTIIVFRGHFFWLLDLKTQTAGPARSITEELGIPSPIDTAFTRCNCQGKLFIIKGDNYWTFDNGVMEPGYPRSVSKDFAGLSGEITAALPVPGTKKRPEALYFFKRGGLVQKYSYPSGSGPTCGKRPKPSAYVIKYRHARQAEVPLAGEINIKLSWKGFPSPVTSALSMFNPKKPDKYEYFIVSWPKVFTIRIGGDVPTLVPQRNGGAQQNIRNWLMCP